MCEQELNHITARYQSLMIGHSAVVMAIGMVAGLLLMFQVLGEIQLWPLFSFKVLVPGTERAWRAAHLGPILNGILCIVLAQAFPLLKLKVSALKWSAWSLICMAWGNTVFYIFSIFGTNRGLSFGTDKFGQGNLADLLAYISAVAAAGAVFIALGVIAFAAFKKNK